MMLRNRLYLTLLLLLFGVSVKLLAQNDKIDALRANYIGKKLELSTAESEKFWPVYNEMNDKLKSLKRNLRQAYRKVPTDMTEKEAEELIALEIKTREAEAEVTKTYYVKIKGIIGIKKLAQLQLYEEDFKKEIIKTIKEK